MTTAPFAADTIAPALAILASALKIEHLSDGAMRRAVDNSLAHLATDPAYEFDGSELRILSQSEREQGTWYVTDGVSCTCKGGRHPICKHRALFRLLLAHEVLLDPGYVRARIVEQLIPPDRDDVPPPDAAPIALNLPDDDWYL